MIEFLKNLYRKPSARMLAQQELEEAKRCLLEHHSATEYHTSMVTYYMTKIDRLKAYVKDEE